MDKTLDAAGVLRKLKDQTFTIVSSGPVQALASQDSPSVNCYTPALALQDNRRSCELGWGRVKALPNSNLTDSLNQGSSGGKPLYLCMHNVWKDPEDEVWQILLIDGDDNCESKGDGSFHPVNTIDNDLSRDLNQGTKGGKEIVLCESHKAPKDGLIRNKPINSLGLTSYPGGCEKNGYESAPVDLGSGLNGNLNEGNEGTKIYLCFFRAYAN